MKVVDLSGRVFRRLTVTKRSPINNKHGRAMWVCQCVCGKETTVSSNALLKENTNSCGCFRDAVIRRRGKNVKAESGVCALLDHYKRNASRKGLPFSLSLEEFKNTTSSRCEYCGSPPSRKVKSRRGYSLYLYTGIDRVNNNVGYVSGNCIPCCFTCNRAKNDMLYDDFMNWVSRVAHFNADKLRMIPV